jgi:hypothetical protein
LPLLCIIISNHHILPNCGRQIPVILSSFDGQISAEALLAAPITTSGDNVYIIWWSNKTGNMEVMFRASTDNGATFGDKMNLSNTTEADSDDAEIAASGDSVYVTWWERNETSDTPVARVSNDNGATFGQMLMLATNGTIGGGGG